MSRDNKPLEIEALDYLKSYLGRYNFKYAEMNFDKNGADLLLIKNYGDDSYSNLKCLKCQSKGRNITKRATDVEINADYVTDNFLVFVYVKKEDTDQVFLYLYTPVDIRTGWGLKDNTYRLYLPKYFLKENEKYIFNKGRASYIDTLFGNTGLQINPEEITNISETKFYYKMWQKIGGLPPFEYLNALFTIQDSFLFNYVIKDSAKFIFFLCASVIVNTDKLVPSLVIDWAFIHLQEMHNNKSYNYKDGKDYSPDLQYTYNTWVKEVLIADSIIGLHLYIGDKEENINAWIMRDGDYGVVYTKK